MASTCCHGRSLVIGALSAFRNAPSMVATCGRNTFSTSSRSGTALTPRRTAVYKESGAILPKPKKTSFGLMRITMVVVPFLYVGTQISKNFAALLEEHDIFVPEDDDDDD